MNENDQIISRYTRVQAIEDGVLVEVSRQAKETGIFLPTVITDHLPDRRAIRARPCCGIGSPLSLIYRCQGRAEDKLLQGIRDKEQSCR
jgi:hypothetical protein